MGEVVMVVLLLLQQERMESHLGLREQLIDLLALVETHLEREAMQRAAGRARQLSRTITSHCGTIEFTHSTKNKQPHDTESLDSLRRKSPNHQNFALFTLFQSKFA
jgi:hypothetical protein